MAQTNVRTHPPSHTLTRYKSDVSTTAPAISSNIPTEIWRCVFDLVPRSVQLALACVNRACLETYRAIRYRALRLEDYGPVTKRLVRILACVDVLCRDPAIASLVHDVYVRPWDISCESRRKKHHLPFRCWLRINRVFSPSEAEQLSRERANRRARRRITRIRDVLATIPAVRYAIEWDEQVPYPNNFFTQLLEPVLRGTMRETLAHLSLKIPAATLLANRLVGIRFPALETLHIELCIFRADLMYAADFIDDIRMFINAIEDPTRPRLSALELGITSSSYPFDLGLLLQGLVPFRALDRFELTIPFNGTHLHDVAGLRRFLTRSAPQLHRLALCTRRASPAEAEPNSAWVLAALRGLTLPRLLSAELALRPVVGPFELSVLAGWLEAHADGLRSLALTDRQLALEEVAVLMAALNRDTARRLRLRVRRLSAALLTVLAQALPLLRKLDIIFGDIGAAEDAADGVVAFSRALRDQEATYQSWHLARLTLRQPF
ncbi:hypothetical protein BD626DRAFT_553988 [Schizophyllum amplum]|uniref:F-box domain-containing protein n=1 Tax=Schizophyllum amplum TaxID=97359 RepID=A0A550CXN9_9AGAR|nr:hypothetical protein BD626DRAFT_553988 [Auriculariopsis ampla]